MAPRRALAHYAARAVLEHVLARHGITFRQQISPARRAALTARAARTPGDLVTQVQGYLKADPAGIRATLDELLAKQLLVAHGAYRVLRPAVGRHLLSWVRETRRG
ncbi:hypothetical protein [Streptomyces sp. NPDC056672]|uniref:hypothetical protein n=1 Tax=Streptomyces sp. NPDC056672 TaxID=3345906 RepID=UPI0036A8B26A